MRLRIIICFGFFLLFQSCDFVYKYLDKEGAEEKKLVGKYIPFEKNPTVEEVQSLLQLYGYNPGHIDGILGRRTRDALVRFQKDNGIKETRKADQETWARLNIFKANKFIEENKLNVQLVQSILASEGYNPGKVDGKFGPKTKSAVKKFQEDHQLKVDGKVGFQTLTILSQYLPHLDAAQETQPLR